MRCLEAVESGILAFPTVPKIKVRAIWKHSESEAPTKVHEHRASLPNHSIYQTCDLQVKHGRCTVVPHLYTLRYSTWPSPLNSWEESLLPIPPPPFLSISRFLLGAYSDLDKIVHVCFFQWLSGASERFFVIC